MRVDERTAITDFKVKVRAGGIASAARIGDGLPLRQVTHLRFPEQEGHWVSARLDVTFRFAEQAPTIASTLGATLGNALSDSSHPVWHNLYFVTFLFI